MSTVNRRTTSPPVPLLVNGERMTQAEFHRRYQAYPEDVKIELIGGIVYMASPVGWPHAIYHSELSFVLKLYAAGTPGVELGDNATTILGEECEPQPDLELRIHEACGGRSRVNSAKYVEGPPELVGEIAHSSRAIDLYQKKTDYEQAGVLEYLVVCVEEQELHWFDFTRGGLLKPHRQGIYRSRVFPGLWIAGPALLAQDTLRLAAVVQQGLASRAHAAFVKRLATARRRQESQE